MTIWVIRKIGTYEKYGNIRAIYELYWKCAKHAKGITLRFKISNVNIMIWYSIRSLGPPNAAHEEVAEKHRHQIRSYKCVTERVLTQVRCHSIQTCMFSGRRSLKQCSRHDAAFRRPPKGPRGSRVSGGAGASKAAFGCRQSQTVVRKSCCLCRVGLTRHLSISTEIRQSAKRHANGTPTGTKSTDSHNRTKGSQIPPNLNFGRHLASLFDPIWLHFGTKIFKNALQKEIWKPIQNNQRLVCKSAPIRN